jgi:hypothetical protein
VGDVCGVLGGQFVGGVLGGLIRVCGFGAGRVEWCGL